MNAISNADLLRQQLKELDIFNLFYPIYAVIVSDESDKIEKDDICSSICAVRQIINSLPFVEERKRLLDYFNSELRQKVAPNIMEIIYKRDITKNDYPMIEKKIMLIIDEVISEVKKINKKPYIVINQNEINYNIEICNITLRDIRETLKKSNCSEMQKKKMMAEIREKIRNTNSDDVKSLKELVNYLINISNSLDSKKNDKGIKY